MPFFSTTLTAKCTFVTEYVYIIGTLKAKFHYASWFGAGFEHVRNRLRTTAGVMEFGFYCACIEYARRDVDQFLRSDRYLTTQDRYCGQKNLVRLDHLQPTRKEGRKP